MSTDSAGQLRRLKDLTAAEFSRLSELLDSCLALPATERTDWLSRLAAEDLRTAEIIRRLLATWGAPGSVSLLETGDVVTRHLAYLACGEETLIGRRVGPYRVLALLGQGGMGSVWLAERADGLFSRQVALKLVHPVLMGRRVSERFAREREILGGLTHPHIARLLDAGITDAGQPFLALEYVAGKPITAFCDERQLGVSERLEFFLQVLSAVQYAHAHLIIHRDLKPSNILVTEEGEAQLLDFGIAKLLTAESAQETELTQLGGRALTPHYAAPEQIAGQPITTAADVYALGVILYELLTGQHPYRLKRDSRGALEDAILTRDPVPPSRVALLETAARARATSPRRLAKALRGDLDTIVIKAMKKSPAERYPTINALAEDISRFGRGAALLARRDSVGYRARKFARRNRMALSVAGVVLAALLAGLAATSYEASVASRQRDLALQAKFRSLTQTAAVRLRSAGDLRGAMGIVLELFAQGQRSATSYTAEALSVFQEARAADTLLVAITGHDDAVASAAFSPDARRVVTASDDKTARIWDAITGREIVRLVGHTGRVIAAAYSPDGSQIVTASTDRTARTWSAVTGQEIVRLQGHADRVWFATFSPDGKRIATASFDNTARIWDAANGREIARLSGHTGWVTSAVFSPDGRFLITASNDRSARIWDLRKGREIVRLSGHQAPVWSATFSPDGSHAATASLDKTARIWDVTTGREILRLTGHRNRVNSVAFSPDGLRVLTASDDKTARLWDAFSGQELSQLSGHIAPVWWAAFAADGRHAVTASPDKTARIWDVGPGRELVRLSGHSDELKSASFSVDRRRVVTASSDRTARIWDSSTGRELGVLSGHDNWVMFAAFSPDGSRVVTASQDRTARIWDASSYRELLRLRGHSDGVTAAAYSPDGQRIVTAANDRTARIWDASNGRELQELRGHLDRLTDAAFSPDGLNIVTASADQTARIWDASKGREKMVLRGHTDLVESAVFAPDSRHVLTGSYDKTARVWDVVTGRQELVLNGHPDQVESAAFSPDGKRIVTSSDDRTARLWDAETAQQLMVIYAHTEELERAEFSPDGSRVITASSDRTARIWNAREAPLDVQIAWAGAAQIDPLSQNERFELGLPESAGLWQPPATRSQCDESAAAHYDPDRRSVGVMADQIALDVALDACGKQQNRAREPQMLYEHARALATSGKLAAARRELEEAVRGGYRAARIDLARLLLQSSMGTPDATRARLLLQQAWASGVSIAAFELGELYEQGVGGRQPDPAQSWAWYRKGAEAGEPNALARFGEKADEAASAEADPAKRAPLLLSAFRYYAAAAERARIENWPDDAWRNWRYRRASRARLLARDGMMEEVASVYQSIRRQYAGRPQSPWQRLASAAGLN